jgi:hypothetical protein
MRFWYSINGKDIGKIRIELVYGEEREIIWQLSSDKGSQWLEGNVGFNSKNMSYKYKINK